jgi:acyl-coenzyme A synthetase/AMP-(fatty) acid ligase
VREALAFSVPSELGVDEVWALVVPTDSLEEEALQKHCGKSSLRRKFRYVAELPRTENGKVDRRRLDAMVQGLAGSCG